MLEKISNKSSNGNIKSFSYRLCSIYFCLYWNTQACVCVITAIQWLYQIQFKKKEGQMYF